MMHYIGVPISVIGQSSIHSLLGGGEIQMEIDRETWEADRQTGRQAGRQGQADSHLILQFAQRLQPQ